MATTPERPSTEAPERSAPVDERLRDGPTAPPRPPVREPEARIVDEHLVRDADGDEYVEAVDDRGRRWYAFRPLPRGRYDMLGFGAAWWLVFWVVIIGLIVWGWGWGWGY